jgi:hypothetical protein
MGGFTAKAVIRRWNLSENFVPQAILDISELDRLLHFH